MTTALNHLKIRKFLGLLAQILGFIAVLNSLAIGFAGLVLYFGQGDLFWLGNPGTGRGVSLMLIVEGFFLELVLALCTTFLGSIVKGNLRHSLNVLEKAKKKFGSGKVKLEDEEEDEEKWDGNLESKEYKSRSRFQEMKKSFEVKAPKCLWVSLLVMAGVNLGLALTCCVLASGEGPLGMGSAMRSYGTDPTARKAVDWVQQAGECCGDQIYTEWLSIQWCTERPRLVPVEVGPPDYVNVCGEKHRGVKNDVPASCCTPPRGPCIHDPLDLLGLGPLHNDGCSGFIEETLDPKYRGIAKVHLFLCGYKLILVVLVVLLRSKEDQQTEKATDEEAKNLLDGEGPPPVTPTEKDVGIRAKASKTSWYSAVVKKTGGLLETKASGEDLTEGQPPAEQSKGPRKSWYSAIKSTKPMKSVSRIISSKSAPVPLSSREPPRSSSESDPREMQAAEGRILPPPGVIGGQTDSPMSPSKSEASHQDGGVPAKKPSTAEGRSPSTLFGRSVSMENRGRRSNLRTSSVISAPPLGSGPESPRADVREWLSEGRRASSDRGGGSNMAEISGHVAQITPSKHVEHRLSVGVVH